MAGRWGQQLLDLDSRVLGFLPNRLALLWRLLEGHVGLIKLNLSFSWVLKPASSSLLTTSLARTFLVHSS